MAGVLLPRAPVWCRAAVAWACRLARHGGNLTAAPNAYETRDGDFWIFCDYCRRWFDGRCVGMTAQRAEASKTWKCPFCTKEA